LGQNTVEDLRIEDGPGNLLANQSRQLAGQWVEIERDNRLTAGLGEARNEPVPDLAAGTGDEADRFTHEDSPKRRYSIRRIVDQRRGLSPPSSRPPGGTRRLAPLHHQVLP